MVGDGEFVGAGRGVGRRCDFSLQMQRTTGDRRASCLGAKSSLELSSRSYSQAWEVRKTTKQSHKRESEKNGGHLVGRTGRRETEGLQGPGSFGRRVSAQRHTGERSFSLWSRYFEVAKPLNIKHIRASFTY